MKTIRYKLLSLFVIAMITSCNNNQGKGNDTTGAGTQQHDDVNSASESRTPAPSMTTDSTGANSPAAQNPAMGSDTITTTGPDPRK